MENDKLDGYWWQLHKNDSNIKKIQEKCHNYKLQNSSESEAQSINMATSMKIQNRIILDSLI